MALTTETYGKRIERKYCAHYLNVDFTNPAWERLGKDLEELNFDMNADVQDRKNIIGELETIVSGYGLTASVDPYYARQGTAFYAWLQDKIDKRAVLDDLKVQYLEVHVWEIVAEEYDATETYAVGDVVRHSSKLYRCTTAIAVAESWNDEHWTETDTSGVYVAFRETAIIVPQSVGGDTTGYQIPFEIHLQGDTTKGTFDTSDKSFTPDA